MASPCISLEKISPSSPTASLVFRRALRLWLIFAEHDKAAGWSDTTLPPRRQRPPGEDLTRYPDRPEPVEAV
jgi:hypothetical protein